MKDMNLNHYNQKLIAIFGTLALIVLGGAFIVGAFKIIAGSFGFNSRDNTSLRVETSEEGGKKAPTQTASFLMPTLIDSVNKIYIVPVSQLNEPSTDKDGELLDVYGSSDSYYRKYKFAGSYNNIIVFDEKSGAKTVVFKEKIHISHFENQFINGSIQILAIKGARQDTNKDGKLNASDLESFFVYNLSDQTLKEYGEKDFGLSDYQLLFQSNKIALSFIKDLNRSGEIDYSEEPQLLKVLNLDTGALEDFVDAETLEELNRTIN